MQSSESYKQLARVRLSPGLFGSVKLAANTDTDQTVWIKKIQKAEVIKHRKIEQVKAEMTIRRSFKHPFSATFLQIGQDARYLYIVTEHLPGGNFMEFLRQLGTLPNLHAKVYVAQVCALLEDLGAAHIVHRDIRPENFGLTAEGFLKLVDYSVAKPLRGKAYTLCGTPEYLAPEALMSIGHDCAVDWWALGVMMFEMLVGCTPFEDPDPMQAYQKILQGIVRYPLTLHPAAKDLMKGLLEVDPGKRFRANSVKEHRWLPESVFSRAFAMKETSLTPYMMGLLRQSPFHVYPDSDSIASSVPVENDCFSDW